MAVNPELIVADEISRVLLFPDASKIETFVKRKSGTDRISDTERKQADRACPLQICTCKFQIKLLVCAVEHGGDVLIPDGDYEIREGDRLHIAVSHREMERFFRMFGNTEERSERSSSAAAAGWLITWQYSSANWGCRSRSSNVM